MNIKQRYAVFRVLRFDTSLLPHRSDALHVVPRGRVAAGRGADPVAVLEHSVGGSIRDARPRPFYGERWCFRWDVSIGKLWRWSI